MYQYKRSPYLFSGPPSCTQGKTANNNGYKSFWGLNILSSATQLCPTICYPMDCSMPSFSAHHKLLELAQTHVIQYVMPSNHLILCCPLLLLSSIFPSIRVFSNESLLPIRWPKNQSFNFGISPSNEYSGLISFRIDLFDLLKVQGNLKSLLQNCISKASILQCSACPYGPILTSMHDYWKNHSFDYTTFVTKVMSLLFNMLSRFVIPFLPRRKCLITSWLQSTSTVILEPRKIKSVSASTLSPSVGYEVTELDADLSFLNVEFQASFFTLLFHLYQQALQFLFTFFC